MGSADVAFYPVANSNPRTLTPVQIEHFNRFGYIAPLDVLTPAETESSRRYFDGLLKAMRDMNDGRNAYAIMGYQTRCRGLWKLARHPVILNYVEDLLGPDFVCWTSHYFCKLPKDQKRVPWHQDATYWAVRPTKTVTLWLAIDDVDAHNAPMQFLPGSHRHGAIPWQQAGGDVVLSQEILDISSYATPYENTLRAGQASLHTSTLVHGSEPNQSERRRCGLTLRYIPSECGAIGEYGDRVLRGAVPGRGNIGKWRLNREPVMDDMTPIHNAYVD